MEPPNDFKTLGEFIGGLLTQQKKEIVEELLQEIQASQEQLRKEIQASQEQTVKDVTSYFEKTVLPLLGEYDARLEHQEAHTTTLQAHQQVFRTRNFRSGQYLPLSLTLLWPYDPG